MHAELDDVLAGRLPNLEDMPRLEYTGMVLAESMRLYPPAWAMGREALEDVSIGPYRLRKGHDDLLQPIHCAARSAMVSRAFAILQPERHTAGGQGGAPAFCVFSIWRRRAAVHRGVIRLDGSHARSGHDCAALASGACAGAADRAAAEDHAAAEERNQGGRPGARDRLWHVLANSIPRRDFSLIDKCTRLEPWASRIF